MSFRKIKILVILWLLSLVVIAPFSCTRIDGGCEGVLVNLYGDDKGVDNTSLCTGMVWYNPFTHMVYEYDAYIKTVDYPPFSVNSKDGSKFTIDPSILVRIKPGTSPLIFKKYRKDLDDVVNTSLYVFVKDAARIVFNQYTAEQIVSNREEVDESFENSVRQTLDKENFNLVQLTPGVDYPESYEAAINAKNLAIQNQLRIENEVKVAEAKAKKLIIEAEAEYKANELRTKALTPQILRKQWIDKWDGKLPTVSSPQDIMLDLDNIENLKK